jgi:hypothetical protein
LDLKLN